MKSKKQQIWEHYQKMQLVHPSMVEIAKKVGVSKAYVHKVIKEYKNAKPIK